MKASVQASELQGSIFAPPSKSAMQRACAAALLTTGKCIIKNAGNSNDDKAALSVIRQLGATVSLAEDHIIIESQGLKSIQNSGLSEINCGESGLSIRMFTPIAALSANEITVKGHGTLEKRPMLFFEEVLPQLGVQIETTDSCIPIRIKGPVIPGNIRVDGSKSSQYITGLLMAFSVIVKEETIIDVENLVSKPYVELTLSIMQHFKMNTPEASRMEAFRFTPQHNEPVEISYTVESDWSSAAFLLVGGAITGDIFIKGLNTFSTQADAAILDALEDAGADISIDEDDTIHIKKAVLNSFEFDAGDCPDLFPPLTVLACFCKGTSAIKGLSRLQYKESDRRKSLEEEFKKTGVNIYSHDDTLFIEGNNLLRGAAVHSHNDHRIAMALAIAGLRCQGKMIIDGAESVNKSYPGFWNDIKHLGAGIEIS